MPFGPRERGRCDAKQGSSDDQFIPEHSKIVLSSNETRPGVVDRAGSRRSEREEPILLELVRNRRERAGQLGPERRHRTDGGDGNQSRNKAVLDGGGPRLVVGKAVEEGLHEVAPVLI